MIEDLAIGISSTIHGYNPDFQDTGGNGRFDAFEMHQFHHRPERFHFEQVLNAVPPLLDHQGHIIPQNAFAARLDAIANQVDVALHAAGPYNLANVGVYLAANFAHLNFNHVTTYIQNELITRGGATPDIFVDPAGNDVEERLGGYFSVINWNPVNICRAPSDNHRGGYPGNHPDSFVALKLLVDPNNADITLPAPFSAFLQANLGNIAANADAFIAASNNCLPLMPQGFYKFNWSHTLAPQL